MSQANFANATIDHLRGYGIRMHRDEWAAVRIWLEKSAEELEAWARTQALEDAARIADGCIADECSPRFVANRIRDAAKKLADGSDAPRGGLVDPPLPPGGRLIG